MGLWRGKNQGSEKWDKNPLEFFEEMRQKEARLIKKVGGRSEHITIARENPYPFLKLAHECLSRVQYLPVFPREGKEAHKRGEFMVHAKFIREYVGETLKLAEEVAEVRELGHAFGFYKRAADLIERRLTVSSISGFSPLLMIATSINNLIKFISFKDDVLIDALLLEAACLAIVFGAVESEAFSKSIEDFALSFVAKIKAERIEDPGNLRGAEMPRVGDVRAEHAFALLNQLTNLIKTNPSVLEDLRPKLSELNQLVEEHRPSNTERTLNARQAGRRIGISHVQVLRLLEEGRLGKRDVEDNPRFSEQECDAYRDSERKRGPKTKKSDDGS